MSSPRSQERSRRRRLAEQRGTSTILAALLLAASGCLSQAGLPSLAPEAEAKGAPLGTFAVSSSPAGVGEAWSLAEGAPQLCVSGEHRIFFGADFVDPRAHAVLRLVVDPLQGAAVRAFDSAEPDRRSLVVRPADCRTFRYRLEPSGWRINDYRDFVVELEVDCELPEGGALRAHVGAAHCS